MSHGGVSGPIPANHFLRSRQFRDVEDGVIEFLIAYKCDLRFRFYQVFNQALPNYLGQALVFFKRQLLARSYIALGSRMFVVTYSIITHLPKARL